MLSETMMSAEYPEIIPEPFGYPPCASYDGNAEDFLSDVVENCHSFGGLTYPDSNHHNIYLQELAAGQEHLLHGPHQDRENQGRSSYSCEPNVNIGRNCSSMLEDPALYAKACVALVYPLEEHPARSEEENEDNVAFDVKVEVQYVDEEPVTSGIKMFDQSLLAVERKGSPVLSLNGDGDTMGSPTPTPSFAELPCTPTMEHPGEETIPPCGVRGSEVATLDEEERRTSLGDNCWELEHEAYKTIDESVQTSKVANRSHEKNGITPLAAPVPKRRFGSGNLQYHPLSLLSAEPRKLSDSAVCTRRDVGLGLESRRQRSISDSETPLPLFVDECDSGFQEDKWSRFQESVNAHYTSPRVSLQSLDLLSQDDEYEASPKMRHNTPLPSFPLDSSQSDDSSGLYHTVNQGTLVHPRDRSRRSLMKHYSQGSISNVSVGAASVSGVSLGGASSVGASSDSPSLNSLLECQSNVTGVTDLLSSLGFDDFESPQLIPDRFIPKDLEFLKPSVMKVTLIEQLNSVQDQPRSPDSLASGQSSGQQQVSAVQNVDVTDLPLGATAENFMDYKPRPSSPVPACATAKVLPVEEELHVPAVPPNTSPLFIDTSVNVGYSRGRLLETVPEETASDLSLSPRWLSPRVSIDHSVLDLGEAKLGNSLNVQKVRKRSLPTNREGYRWSIGSLGESDTGDSIHLSVTSYDDMIAAERERERENLPQVTSDDNLTVTRRRRRGVYTPPQALLSWLSTQKTINEENNPDPDELPWPFNEQARLRKSLTEISIAQKLSQVEQPSTDNLEVAEDRHSSASHNNMDQRDLSVSPISTPNMRLSPVSDEDEEPDATRQRSHHRRGLARPPSPSMTSDVLHADIDYLLPRLEHNDTLVFSTASLLRTERGSQPNLSPDHCPPGPQYLHVYPSEAKIDSRTAGLLPPSVTLPVTQFLARYPEEGFPAVTAISVPNAHSSRTAFQSSWNGTALNLSDTQSNSTSSSLKTYERHESEEVDTPSASDSFECSLEDIADMITPTDKEPVRQRLSSGRSILDNESLIGMEIAGHTGVLSSLQSCSSVRRKQFASQRAKSFEEEQSSAPVIPSSGRKRRKAVVTSVPPNSFNIPLEQQEFEKFMVL